MTAPDPAPTRPLRVAGLALLGLAAIALVIGLFSLIGGDEGDDTADGGGNRPPSSASADPDPTESAEPSGAPSQPPSSAAPTTTTTTTTTTTPPSPPVGSPPAGPPPGGDGNGEPGKDQQVRVYNNSTVGGLGARARNDLEEAGWTVAGVGNYSSGVIPTTTVYYRPGTAEQAAAELLGDEFGMRVEPRFAGLGGSSPGLIVILTNDYQGPGGERAPTDKNDK